jgi:hypothetical protein
MEEKTNMSEHRVRLTIGGIFDDQIERLLSGLHEVAAANGPVLSSNVNTDQVEVVLALEAQDAADAIAAGAKTLRLALRSAVFPPRPILHAEAEVVDVGEVAAA